ncbi:transglutaminase domain-containing protein [Methanobrevibacter olleyae]|uniref:Adhesin-like protein with transglutaminase and PMBR domains n=1 Tax=Methanobrevibacter olleyae TaxID=294671 RepID=A0A126QYW9_METOL|nr:transglutaminase domain-containing protein [Methanobrevibacter olleyae]AMK14972.1 adhesin-like protein with transglutaminase and PMBR domains [Methanobrevibacter olleyae]
MIFLALLLVLIFSISSASSQSIKIEDTNNINDNKVLKSNSLSNSLITEKTNLSATTKVKTNKTNTTKKTTTEKTKENTTTVNKKTLAKTSASFMNYVEKNGKFPKVKISNKNYSNTEYLYLISKAIENNSNSEIEIKKNLIKPYNNSNSKSVKGNLNKTEYVKIASKTREFIEKNKRAPNWASSSKGNIPYNQLILTFSKCLDNYNKTNKLPNSIKLDDLDLNKIKTKLNKKTSKSTTDNKVNSTNKSTTNTSSKITTNKSTTNTSSKITTNKSTTNTSSKITANKPIATKTNLTKTEPKDTATKINPSTENKNNLNLVERTMNSINSILNNILEKLNPFKYKLDLTRSDEANIKLNNSKVNIDGDKSTINVKVSTKDRNNLTNANTTTTKKTNTTNTKNTNTTTKTNTTSSKNTNTTKTTSKTKANIASINKTSINEDLKKYLSSSKNCQVNNKAIKDLAKTLTSSLKTNYEKAKKLFNWVRDNIQYTKYRNTRKGAVKTLQTKKGNCVDQSHLLIALSRASGIPARYVKGTNCKFSNGYVSGHIWTQMYIGNKWIVADTTSSRNSLGKIKNWNTKNYTLCGEFSSISF